MLIIPLEREQAPKPRGVTEPLTLPGLPADPLFTKARVSKFVIPLRGGCALASRVIRGAAISIFRLPFIFLKCDLDLFDPVFRKRLRLAVIDAVIKLIAIERNRVTTKGFLSIKFYHKSSVHNAPLYCGRFMNRPYANNLFYHGRTHRSAPTQKRAHAMYPHPE